jgi:hypothetical protein
MDTNVLCYRAELLQYCPPVLEITTVESSAFIKMAYGSAREALEHEFTFCYPKRNICLWNVEEKRKYRQKCAVMLNLPTQFQVPLPQVSNSVYFYYNGGYYESNAR